MSNLFTHRTTWRALVTLAFMVTTFCAPSFAQESCERTGIQFGFFNGVDTKLEFAQEVVDRDLPEQYGRTTPNGEPITYALYYNDTEGFSDFVETFDQRLQEHNGLLAGRFELFFSAMKGEGSWWEALTGVVPARMRPGAAG